MFLKGKRDYQGCFPAEHPPWAQCIETLFCLPLDTSNLPAAIKCSGYFQILSCYCCNLCFSALVLLICFLIRVNRDKFWEQSYGYCSEDIDIFSVDGRNMSNLRPGDSFSVWEVRKMDYMGLYVWNISNVCLLHLNCILSADAALMSHLITGISLLQYISVSLFTVVLYILHSAIRKIFKHCKTYFVISVI